MRVKKLKQEKIDQERKKKLEKYLQVIQLQKDRAQQIEDAANKI